MSNNKKAGQERAEENIFRSWDDFNEVMVYSKDFKNLAEYFSYCQKCIDGGNWITQMRHTGRSGVYEGDTIEFDHINKSYLKKTTYKVIFRDCNFCIIDNTDNTINFWLGSKELRNIKVTGNIYQKHSQIERSRS